MTRGGTATTDAHRLTASMQGTQHHSAHARPRTTHKRVNFPRRRASLTSTTTICRFSPRAARPLPVARRPREEYLAVSLKPSPPVSDPPRRANSSFSTSTARCCCGVRTQRRVPQPQTPQRWQGRGGGIPRAPGDPYGDPTQLRPLRTVHRRPYLTSFAAYILHEETKKWLDTMVWSSAQRIA